MHIEIWEGTLSCVFKNSELQKCFFKMFSCTGLKGVGGAGVCARVFSFYNVFPPVGQDNNFDLQTLFKKKKKGPLIASSNSWKITEEGNTNLWFCLKVLVITSDSVTVGGGLELQSVLQEHSFVSPHWLFGCSPHCQQLGGGVIASLNPVHHFAEVPPGDPCSHPHLSPIVMRVKPVLA